VISISVVKKQALADQNAIFEKRATNYIYTRFHCRFKHLFLAICESIAFDLEVI